MYWLPRGNVLVPTDYSAASADAIHAALAMVECGRNVHVLHSLEPAPKGVMQARRRPHFTRKSGDTARQSTANERLQAFLLDHEISGVTPVIHVGDPASCATRYARENEMDLIVMATHAHEHAERRSIGTVTQRVLLNADCPVLVLRPDGRVTGGSSQTPVRRRANYSPVESEARGVVAGPRPR